MCKMYLLYSKCMQWNPSVRWNLISIINIQKRSVSKFRSNSVKVQRLRIYSETIITLFKLTRFLSELNASLIRRSSLPTCCSWSRRRKDSTSGSDIERSRDRGIRSGSRELSMSDGILSRSWNWPEKRTSKDLRNRQTVILKEMRMFRRKCTHAFSSNSWTAHHMRCNNYIVNY